jgi:hypothetical protein
MFMMLFLLLACKSAASSVHEGAPHITFTSPGADPVFDGGANTVAIPMKKAGNLIIIEAQVDTVVGNFVLDTGAPYLVLNATYFRDMPHTSDQEANGVNGNSSGTFRTQVRDLSLGLDLHLSRLTADVTDLSAIENSKGIKILGLLGTQLFRKLAITVDHFHNVLYLHKLNSKGEIAPGERVFEQPEMRTAFKYVNDVIFMKGQIAERSFWFAFDTGAECNLLSHEAPKAVIQPMRVVSRSAMVGVGGKSGRELIYANFDRLVIGNYLLSNNRILITDLGHLGKAYGGSVDAVLGYDFFARGIFTINFAKKEFEMYIYKH